MTRAYLPMPPTSEAAPPRATSRLRLRVRVVGERHWAQSGGEGGGKGSCPKSEERRRKHTPCHDPPRLTSPWASPHRQDGRSPQPVIASSGSSLACPPRSYSHTWIGVTWIGVRRFF